MHMYHIVSPVLLSITRIDNGRNITHWGIRCPYEIINCVLGGAVLWSTSWIDECILRVETTLRLSYLVSLPTWFNAKTCVT